MHDVTAKGHVNKGGQGQAEVGYDGGEGESLDGERSLVGRFVGMVFPMGEARCRSLVYCNCVTNASNTNILVSSPARIAAKSIITGMLATILTSLFHYVNRNTIRSPFLDPERSSGAPSHSEDAFTDGPSFGEGDGPEEGAT